jgi:hypothetical protein
MTKQTLYVPVTIYDDHNTGIIVKHIHSGHKYPVNKKTGYFFTEEQLNELLSNVIKNTLKTRMDLHWKYIWRIKLSHLIRIFKLE